MKITEEPKETPTSPTSVEKDNKPKENTPVPTTPVSHYVSQEQSSENKQMLPNTGESPSTLLLTIGLTFIIIGLTILSTVAFSIFRKN